MSAANELEKTLAAQGYKLTKNRRLILQGMLNINDWATALDIFQYVAKLNPRINFSTIYRNLDAMSESEMLCLVEHDNTRYYRLNKENQHHHHLICKSCHKVVHINYCPLDNLSSQELQSFSDVQCKFELYGYCQECQSQSIKSGNH